MASCSSIQALIPICCTWAASAEVGPKAACSRKRRAADTEATGFCTPTGTASGAETRGPLDTVRFSMAAGPAKPVTFRVDASPNFVLRARPFNFAIDCAVKPVPVTVVEKTPSGRGDTPVAVTVGGTLVRTAMLAVDWPTELIAVTVSVPDAGITAGAVYRPVAETVPDTVVKLVAPGAVNCWVPPRITLTDTGAITGAEVVVPPPPVPPVPPVAPLTGGI